MEESAIIAAIRRGIKEPSPVTIDDIGISAVIVRGVNLLGFKILEVDPSRFNARVSITSNTNVFDKPSDCFKLLKVWDLGGTATAITGAADNGSGEIRITSTAHGLSDDDIVFIHDVGGTTEANGTFKITYVTANTVDLDGSTFTNIYTSGGKIFAEPSSPDEITLIDLADANLSHTDKWYPRKDQIVIDDNGFANDIIVDYIAMPTVLTDIDASLHEWLISFGIADLMVIDYADQFADDKIKTLRFHEVRLSKMEKNIEKHFRASSEPIYVRDVMNL